MSEMLDKLEFRPLRADEIEIRVATVNEKGCSLLLYKNARCDMNILDETVGADHWQRRHYDCKGNLFCSVGILCGEEWIWKDDCGTESNAEKQKGEASDSFKRACFNWGIGRELYTAPFIWVPADRVTLNKKGDKYSTYDRFELERIALEGKQIMGLAIKKEKGPVVYTWGTLKGLQPQPEEPTPPPANDTPPEQPTPPAKLTPIQCEACGNEIGEIVGKSGNIMRPEVYAAAMMKKYRRVLCPQCVEAHETIYPPPVV